MYHYSLLFPKQVEEKVEYYSHWGLYSESRDSFEEASGRRWLRESYLSLRAPFHVHNVYRHLSWLRRFRGPWPPQVGRMWDDVLAGRVPVARRPMADAERLLASPVYVAAGYALEALESVDRCAREGWRMWGPRVRSAVRGRDGAA